MGTQSYITNPSRHVATWGIPLMAVFIVLTVMVPLVFYPGELIHYSLLQFSGDVAFGARWIMLFINAAFIVGVLLRKNWARLLGVVFSVACVLFASVQLLLVGSETLPALRSWYYSNPNVPTKDLHEMINISSNSLDTGISVIVMLVFATVSLFVLRRNRANFT